MPTYKYLIIGGGMTADAAVTGIRSLDPDGSIGLISDEDSPPYNRPPLSKKLWKGMQIEKIWRKAADSNAALHLRRKAVALDPGAKRVQDDQGTVYTYDKLLLATGGAPRRLPYGGDQIIYFRYLNDYYRLREISARGGRVAVIGGGFIGSEVAAALAMNGVQVVMIFPEATLGANIYPPGLSQYLTDYYRQKQVDIQAGEAVIGLEARNGHLALSTRSGSEIVVEGVVAGIGIIPNVELAQAAGLQVENGIVVDESLRTSSPDIYAAGDVANFYNPALGKRVRVEHEDNANTMGRAAGRNMAGAAEPYHYLPYFYSDLFDLGYEAVGELGRRLNVVEDWAAPNQKGIIYYLQDGRVRGALLWDVWGQVEAARQLIAEPGPFTPQDLKGRLPAQKT
jgi:3-phenylpropionate/trans-cinnamate dioxygenase ferredoxin reductase subunit